MRREYARVWACRHRPGQDPLEFQVLETRRRADYGVDRVVDLLWPVLHRRVLAPEVVRGDRSDVPVAEDLRQRPWKPLVAALVADDDAASWRVIRSKP